MVQFYLGPEYPSLWGEHSDLSWTKIFLYQTFPKKPKSKQFPLTNKNLRTRQGQELFSSKTTPKSKEFSAKIRRNFFVPDMSRENCFNHLFNNSSQHKRIL